MEFSERTFSEEFPYAKDLREFLTSSCESRCRSHESLQVHASVDFPREFPNSKFRRQQNRLLHR